MSVAGPTSADGPRPARAPCNGASPCLASLRVSSPASWTSLAMPKSVSRGTRSLGSIFGRPAPSPAPSEGALEVPRRIGPYSRPRAARQDDVVRLDVAMEDAAVVGVLDRVGDRGHPSRRQPSRHGPILRLQPATQAGPGAELRGDEVAERADLARIEDPDDVGMIEPGGGRASLRNRSTSPGETTRMGERQLQGAMRPTVCARTTSGIRRNRGGRGPRTAPGGEGRQREPRPLGGFHGRLAIGDRIRRREHLSSSRRRS